MADDETLFKKADTFLRKWTGGDYYERSKERMKEKFKEAAPGTAAAVQGAADVLGTGAQFEAGGGPLIGMAKKAREAKVMADAAKKAASAKRAKKAVETVKKVVNKRTPVIKAKKPADSGTLTSASRISDIKRSRGPYPVPALRKENLPARVERGIVKSGGRSVTRYSPERRDIVARKENLPARIERGASAADKGRIVGLSRMGKLAASGAAAGLGALGYKAYKAGNAKATNADAQRSSYYMSNPTQRPYDVKTSPAPKVPKPKPRPAKPEKKAAKVVARAAKKEVKPRFYGNWVGATPTAMQARAGMPRKKK